MTEKYKCKICGKEVSANNSYVGSHIKRVHNLTLYEYFSDYDKEFINIKPEFKIENCAFCNRDAIPNLTVDYSEKTFYRSYEVYSCNDIECLNKRSLEYLGVPYNKGIKFDRISCIMEYGAKLKKISIKEQKFIRSRGVRENTSRCDLKGFIERYGESKGTEKYKERNNKIAYSSTKQYYIDKFGIIEGTKKWEHKTNALIYSSSLNGNIERFGEIKGTKRWKKIQASKRSWKYQSGPSKISFKIKDILDNLNFEYVMEYMVEMEKRNYFVDYYLPNLNVIIEYYGDYWHGNPAIYQGTEILKQTKMTYEQIWKKDKNRLEKIKEKMNPVSILIIWDSYKLTETNLLDALYQITDNNTIMELN